MTQSRWSLETLLVHAGNDIVKTEPYFATSPVIYPSTSFQVSSPELLDQVMEGSVPGFSYARHGNPTVQAFAHAMARLEEAEVGVATASGMAAIDMALYAACLQPGDSLLLSQDLYGASLNLASTIWTQYGIRSVVADFTDLTQVEDSLRINHPKAMFFEMISNPLLKVVDMSSIVELAESYGCQVIVDNTFTTPLMVQPNVLGADLVVHSATKYLGGHGDAMGGVVVGKNVYSERLHQYLKLRGAVLGPFEAWLLHRGLKTLAVRFERQCANALDIAESLAASERFERIYYPLLPDHPSHLTARRYFGTMGGAVVTLEIPGGKDGVYQFIKNLHLVGSATTVGDVYTLCLYPLIASHRNQTPEERRTMGITEGTVRIAVGLEDPQDVADDILQAMK